MRWERRHWTTWGEALLAALAVSLIGIPDSAGTEPVPSGEPPTEAAPLYGISAAPAEQPFSASNSTWEGYSELMRLAFRELGEARVKPTAKLDYSTLEPKDAILIVHPSRRLDERSLSSFLTAGGRVGILDDYGQSASFLSRFGIVARSAPADPERQLRANPNLPIAVPSVQVVEGHERGRHPIAAQINEVVTNHPRVFEHPDLTRVLEIRDKTGQAHALALTGVIAESGRLFVLGDPSVFINLMVRYPDNRRLARGLLRYLAQRSPNEGPTHASGAGRLYVVVNDFEETGSFGDQDDWLQTMRRRLEEAAEALSALDAEGLPPALSLSLAAILAICLLSTQVHSQLRVPRLLAPTYTRTPLLAAQTGLSSRVAVLGSPQASPVLALSEMDRALRESVAEGLGVDARLAPAALSKEAAVAGLSHQQSELLERTLDELGRLATNLEQKKTQASARRDLRRLHEASHTILSEIERMRRAS